jgi:hypothetical protein
MADIVNEWMGRRTDWWTDFLEDAAFNLRECDCRLRKYCTSGMTVADPKIKIRRLNFERPNLVRLNFERLNFKKD